MKNSTDSSEFPNSSEPPKLQLSSYIPLMFALLTAVFAFQLNASMLSPALATMEEELSATTAQIGLTQTAFFLSLIHI